MQPTSDGRETAESTCPFSLRNQEAAVEGYNEIQVKMRIALSQMSCTADFILLQF